MHKTWWRELRFAFRAYTFQSSLRERLPAGERRQIHLSVFWCSSRQAKGYRTQMSWEIFLGAQFSILNMNCKWDDSEIWIWGYVNSKYKYQWIVLYLWSKIFTYFLINYQFSKYNKNPVVLFYGSCIIYTWIYSIKNILVFIIVLLEVQMLCNHPDRISSQYQANV